MSEQLTEAQSKYVGPVDDGKDEGRVTLTLTKPVKPYIVLSCDLRYVGSIEGVLHIVQLVVSLAGLVFLVCSGTTQVPFLSLVLSWHCRVFIFVSVLAFLLTLFLFLLNVSTLIEAFALNWPLMTLLDSGLLSFLYLFSSSLVASGVTYYQSQADHVPTHTIKYLIVASVLGYVCFLLYAVSAVLAYRVLTRTRHQFAAHHLHSAHMTPQMSVERS